MRIKSLDDAIQKKSEVEKYLRKFISDKTEEIGVPEVCKKLNKNDKYIYHLLDRGKIETLEAVAIKVDKMKLQGVK